MAKKLKLPYHNYEGYVKYVQNSDLKRNKQIYFGYSFLMLFIQLVFQLRLILGYYIHDLNPEGEINPEIKDVRFLSIIFLALMLIFRLDFLIFMNPVSIYKSFHRFFDGKKEKFNTTILSGFLIDLIFHLYFVIKQPTTLTEFYLGLLLPCTSLILIYMTFLIAGIRMTNWISTETRIFEMLNWFNPLFLTIAFGILTERIFNNQYSEEWIKGLVIFFCILWFYLTCQAYCIQAQVDMKVEQMGPPIARQFYFLDLAQFVEMIMVISFITHEAESKSQLIAYLFLPQFRAWGTWLIWGNWGIVKTRPDGVTIKQYYAAVACIVIILFYTIFPPIYCYSVIDPRVQAYREPECVHQDELFHRSNQSDGQEYDKCMVDSKPCHSYGYIFWIVYMIFGIGLNFSPIVLSGLVSGSKNKSFVKNAYSSLATSLIILTVSLVSVLLDQKE